jgi:3-oxoadipate CoA-transferase alpha subunit
LIYRKTSRNFGPIMAAAATISIVQVDHIVELGEINPEEVVTPGIYINRVVQVSERVWMKDGKFNGTTKENL